MFQTEIFNHLFTNILFVSKINCFKPMREINWFSSVLDDKYSMHCDHASMIV